MASFIPVQEKWMQKAMKDTHVQATHYGAVMAPCFHAILPFLIPISLF